MTTVIPTPYDTEIAAIQAGLKRPIYYNIHQPVYLQGAQTGYRVAKTEGTALLEAAKAAVLTYRIKYKDAQSLDMPVAMAKLDDAIAAYEGR